MTLNIAAYVQQAFTVAKSFGLATDVTFTTVKHTHTPSTGVMSAPVTTTVVGTATREDGNPKEYERLGLVELNPITLLFQPATSGEEPPLGSSVQWEGAPRVVRSVSPTAPSGVSLVLKVIVT